MPQELTPEQTQVAAEVQSAQHNQEAPPEQIYFNSSSYGGQEVVQPEWEEARVVEQEQVSGIPQQEQPTEPSTPEQSDLQALADKLGIKPEDLGKAPEPEPTPPPASPDDWYANQFGSEEAKQFAENFKKYVGLDIKEVYGLINNTAQVTQGLEQWRQQAAQIEQKKQADAQMATLQQELGDDFHTVMPQVMQEFDRIRKVNPQQAAALDNLDGARYLAAFIKQRGVQQAPTHQQPQVPQYDFPNVRRPVTGNRPVAPTIKMSEFVTWSDKEVQDRYNDILMARQHGTFIHDI